jgi:putative ABC transport system ATP-binding protein
MSDGAQRRVTSKGTTMSILLDRVSKTYGTGAGTVHALRNVTVEIPDRAFTVILGPSGSGKTTLLNLIGAIDDPTEGRLVVNGRDVSAFDDEARTAFRRSQIGFVFQFFNLIPTLTAEENVELVAELVAGRNSGIAAEVLTQVGLGDRRSHFPGELSGGEQQRVAIARALAKQPPLLLCDEPTGELDFETGRLILGLLRRLNVETGKTVLLVTHNAAVGEMADRVVRLRSGEITEDRRIEHPLRAEQLEW